MHTREECPILQHTAAGDELGQATCVRRPKFGTNGEDCLGFRGEIEGLFRLVIIDSPHPIPIIEEHGGSASLVCKESVEPSVQTRRKSGVLLVEMDEIRGLVFFEFMSSLLESASGSRLGVFLTREDENDIPILIAERHSIAERVLPRNPPRIYPQRLVNPGSRPVKGLVIKRCDHLQQLRLRLFAWHFGDESNDPRHNIYLLTMPL